MCVSDCMKTVIRGGMAGIVLLLLLSVRTAAQETDLAVWVCPAGGYEEESTVRILAEDYQKTHPDVRVNTKVLDPVAGPEEISSVLGTEDAPDIVIAAPEDIVTRWGSQGYMVDLTELWDEQIEAETDGEVKEACISPDGIYYQMPLFRDVYTMAINYEAFRDTGVLQYLNEDAHSWKDSGFIDCVLVMREHELQYEKKDITVCRIPCRDQKDQRQFMSFITNLSNGSLIDDMRTSYTLSSSSVKNSFAILRNMQGKGLSYAPDMTSEEELEEFLNGELPVTFFWSYYRNRKYADQTDFTVFPMMYPNSKNKPVLSGDIRGFGVTDSGDEKKIKEAIEFVRFFTEDPDEYSRAVSLSQCFPVRSRLKGTYVGGLYQDDPDSRLFRFFMDYFKDYTPTMPLFSELEAEWPGLVRQIAEGNGIGELTAAIDEKLNTRLEAEYGLHAADME